MSTTGSDSRRTGRRFWEESMSFSKKRPFLVGVSLLVMPVLSSAPLHAQTASSSVDSNVDQAPAGAKAASDGDIVVTARLRHESLMDVPVAIPALNAQKIDRKSTRLNSSH